MAPFQVREACRFPFTPCRPMHRDLHPYTQLLLSAVPIPDPTIEKGRQRMDRPEILDDYINNETVYKEVAPGHFVATLV